MRWEEAGTTQTGRAGAERNCYPGPGIEKPWEAKRLDGARGAIRKHTKEKKRYQTCSLCLHKKKKKKRDHIVGGRMMEKSTSKGVKRIWKVRPRNRKTVHPFRCRPVAKGLTEEGTNDTKQVFLRTKEAHPGKRRYEQMG